MQRDLADMQLLVRLKMETTEKAFAQGLLMANIYHYDVTTANSCRHREYFLFKCVQIHVVL